MNEGVRVQMIIDAPDDLYNCMSPPGLKEAVLHAQSALQEDERGACHQPGRHRPQLPLRRIPGDEPVGHVPTSPATSTTGVWACCTRFPNEGSAEGTVVIAPGDIVILPYCRYVTDPIHLEIRGGHITSIEGGLDAVLMRDWLAEGQTGAGDRDPYAVSHLGWGLNPQCRWDCAGALWRRARAQPRRGAQLPRQLPVLYRPEHAGRRQAHHARPLRRADARLHHRARRQRRRRKTAASSTRR